MNGRLSDCVLLSYRTPKESVQRLLPTGLELVTRGPWAFWNVVCCRVEGMRPAGIPGCVPGALGVSYHHVAYRLLVQAMTDTADLRRGLYFVRSDADAKLLGVAGNLLSDFRFHSARVSLHSNEQQWSCSVSQTGQKTGDADLQIDLQRPASLPADSCFPTLGDARSALRYEPLGLNVEGTTLKLAEVMRDGSRWRERPVHVEHARFNFFTAMGQHDVKLELATRVAPMDYRWRLGRCERLLSAGQQTAPSAEEAAAVA